ncbi:hypothetical protein Hypma_013262 [Hypsizygus marmoreus]|uniref:Sugar phosphate phosphatase n=1 Tax=Hypsizygus marmoreus TaxID=39966 RepID=A0A369JJQ0_HYPMA|nr:hypothetical protein Hypma_013262 [Hypsizygus marmoreus]
MTFEPPHPPYDPTDKTGFSYETVVKRWPVIITGVIDQIHNVCHKLSLELQRPNAEKETAEAKVAEGKVIIEKLSKLKYQMGRDHPLEPIPADGEGQVETYNLELQRLGEAGKNTWFTAPWLYAECYLYRLLRSFCAATTHWNNYDPFLSQKVSTFAQSGTSILKIATSMHELESEKDALNSEKLGILFSEMVQMCLWGNATDLSLLTHLSPDDIAHLQSVGKEAQAARQQFILKDDQSQLWEHIQSLKSGRIDFVLDNAGFELFTDLVFADFLVSFTPYVSEVQFHPKLIPWFVSDVTPADFSQTLSSLLDPSFFSRFAGPNEGSTPSSEHLKHMVTRWKNYVDEGVFKLSVPLATPLGGSGSEVDLFGSFWTSPWPYWNLKDYAPELFSALQESSLVVFKGDLNYRKLTGDIQWPVWTPFATAIGPLAGSFPILSLRTNKADIVVGVDREIAEKLDESGEKWRVNGRYALISFLEASPLEFAITS